MESFMFCTHSYSLKLYDDTDSDTLVLQRLISAFHL